MSTDDDCIRLPHDVIKRSVGFTVDAGGSVTKLMYRSKLDYENGKFSDNEAKHDEGFVRTSLIPVGKTDQLLQFIVDNCDLTTEANESTVYTTGLQAAPLTDALEKKFIIKIQNLNEFDCIERCLHYVVKNRPFDEVVWPDDEEGIQEGNKKVASYAAFMSSTTTDDESTQPHENDKHDILPCLVTVTGSSRHTMKFSENTSGKAGIVDIAFTGGKQFLSVANLICGEVMSFDEIMDLVNKGDASKVHLTAKDFVTNTNNDIYSMLPLDVICYHVGKPALQEPNSFSKADLLASWFELICAEFARESRLLCRVEGVRRMLFSGGFCENANARKLLTANWMVNQAFYQKNFVTSMHFMRHGAHMAALGAFIHLGDSASIN